jgi:cell wall-associated NlpC family hydrolase
VRKSIFIIFISLILFLLTINTSDIHASPNNGSNNNSQNKANNSNNVQNPQFPSIIEQKSKLENTIQLNKEVINSNRRKSDEIDKSISEIELYLDKVDKQSKNNTELLAKQESTINAMNKDISELKKQKLIEEYNMKSNQLNNLLFINKAMFKKTDVLNVDNYMIDPYNIKSKEEELKIMEHAKQETLNNVDIQQETGDTLNLVYSDLINKFLKRVQLESYLLNENELSAQSVASIKSKLEVDLREKSMYVFLTNRGDSHSVKGDKIVEIAQKYLGIPYVWGGVDPKGMDCSGLVLLVMNELGIKPPRVSLDQSQFGQKIDLSEIQPGDLLFFDTLLLGHVTHVGIYIGNGQILQAPQTGDVVKISNLTRYYQSAFITARRY